MTTWRVGEPVWYAHAMPGGRFVAAGGIVSAIEELRPGVSNVTLVRNCSNCDITTHTLKPGQAFASLGEAERAAVLCAFGHRS